MTRCARLILCCTWLWPVLACAVTPEQLQSVESAQHSFVQSNGGSPEEELSIENSLAAAQANANFALVDQIEGTGMHATVEQTGSGNVAMVLQGFGDGNEASVTQTGMSNEAYITQAGNGNVVSMLTQNGNFNVATITQQGNLNAATVNQLNDSNKLSLTQQGSYDIANIEQNGNTDLTVTQTNAGGTAYTANQLTLKAWADAGATPTFSPITLNGPGSTQLYLCNGSASYCSQVLPH